MLTFSIRDASRPLGIQFRPFANNVHDTKYHKQCTMTRVPIVAHTTELISTLKTSEIISWMHITYQSSYIIEYEMSIWLWYFYRIENNVPLKDFQPKRRRSCRFFKLVSCGFTNYYRKVHHMFTYKLEWSPNNLWKYLDVKHPMYILEIVYLQGKLHSSSDGHCCNDEGKIMRALGPLHTWDWEPVTITLQALSLVEKVEPVQVRFTLRLRDQHSMWMQDGCKSPHRFLHDVKWIMFHGH